LIFCCVKSNNVCRSDDHYSYDAKALSINAEKECGHRHAKYYKCKIKDGFMVRTNYDNEDD
jgi:hypothetical protein